MTDGMPVAEARRCVDAIADYLRRHDESPRAGADLLKAVESITSDLTAQLRQREQELGKLRAAVLTFAGDGIPEHSAVVALAMQMSQGAKRMG